MKKIRKIASALCFGISAGLLAMSIYLSFCKAVNETPAIENKR